MGWSYQNKPPLGWSIDPGSGLVPEAGFWPFWEGSGSIVNDLSGNGFDMSLVHSPLWTGCKYGQGLLFDGTNDYGSVPSGIMDVIEATNTFTIVVWVYNTDLTADKAVVGQFGTTNQFLLWMDTGGAGDGYALLVSGDAGNTQTSTDSINAVANTWQHVVGVWDGTYASIYIDGHLDNISFANANIMNSSNESMGIGSQEGDNNVWPFQGKIDHINIYNRVLASGEIAKLKAEPFCMFMAPTKVAVIVGFQSVGGVEYIETNRAVSLTASIVPTDTQQMLETNRAVTFEANTTKEYTTWFGINSSHLDSLCGQGDGTQLAYALNGASRWYHYSEHPAAHWFKLNLGMSCNITKFKSRSNYDDDPTSVNIYVSETDGNWGAAVATGISTWQDTDIYVEYDSTDKQGQYIYVTIDGVEGSPATGTINWGDGPIFDAYGTYTNTITDTHQMLDTNKAVSVATSVVPSDTSAMVDTNKDVSVAAGAAESDAQQMVDTSLGVTVAASLNVVDAKQMTDTNLAVSFAASVTVTDAKTYLELLRSVLIAASVTESDISAMTDTNKALSLAASVGLETEIYTGVSIPWLFGFVLLRQHTS